jgi:hypothetical protein
MLMLDRAFRRSGSERKTDHARHRKRSSSPRSPAFRWMNSAPKSRSGPRPNSRVTRGHLSIACSDWKMVSRVHGERGPRSHSDAVIACIVLYFIYRAIRADPSIKSPCDSKSTIPKIRSTRPVSSRVNKVRNDDASLIVTRDSYNSASH